jgi:hypothetical protein
MKYLGKFVKNKFSFLVLYAESESSVDYAKRWEGKTIATTIFQFDIYHLRYKESGLAETPKFARGTAGFLGTQFEYH